MFNVNTKELFKVINKLESDWMTINNGASVESILNGNELLVITINKDGKRLFKSFDLNDYLEII